MGIESVAMSAMAVLNERPRLAKIAFGVLRRDNIFADERFSWPYPVYERVLPSGHVHYDKMFRQWVVIGYDEVHEVLRSPNTTMRAVAEVLLGTSRYKKLSPGARESFARWLLVTDAPDHTRLRGAVSRAFTPKQIAAYAPLVERVVGEIVDDLPESGVLEAVDTITDRLPIHVIAEVLGLPADRRSWLHTASREIIGMVEPLTRFDPTSMSARFAELDDYFFGLIAERRRSPGDDLVSVLASAEGDDALTDDEIVAMIAVLLTAGHETVAGLLGNSLVALARHPDQRQLLRGRPDLIDNAIEELLRFDPPVQMTGRVLTADITIGDVTIPKGDACTLFLAASNRDARRLVDGDQLRLDRDRPKSLSFGFGPHHCLGAALARMEARTALPLLLDRLGDYTVDEDRIEWKRSLALRGPTRLPLRLNR